MNQSDLALTRPSTPGLPTATWQAIPSWLGTLAALVLIFLYFAIAAPPEFRSQSNIELIARQSAIIGTLALGMTMVMILGGIDLSVGSVVALGTVVVAGVLAVGAPPGGLMDRYPVLWPWVAVAAGILAGALCGLVNGILIAGLNIMPFIVTLGMYLIARGVAKGLAHETLVNAPPSWLDNLLAVEPGQRWFLAPVVWAAIAGGLGLIGLGRRVAARRQAAWATRPGFLWTWRAVLLAAAAAGIIQAHVAFPAGVQTMLGLAIAVAALLRYTRFGRHTFAIGSNEATARLCGVAVRRLKIIHYTLLGAFAGLAGVLLFSRLSVGDPTTAAGMELDVIAAVVIGGASLTGGEGSVFGSLLGALIMNVIRTGYTQMGKPNWQQEILTGAIIVAAVAFDRLRHRKN